MTTASVQAESTHAAPDRGHRLTMNRLGLWLFLVSDMSFFAAVISSRYFISGVQTPEEVNQVLGLALASVLVISSFTAYRAEMAAAHGDHAGLRRYLVSTIALGLVFMAGVGFEWHEAYLHFPPSTGFGTVLFTITGIHATHVLSGIVILALVIKSATPGRYGPGNYWPVEGAVKYWHLVDVAWVFIYPTLYLVR
ncbi:MAG: heme-copper oxidase subunit III [Chloroflexi bacterium]|nr:heme-copper oxidase subunit III [Chloroflexota bacterium]